MGVWVGPGRGSAAGAAVAYALGITNVDPIKYDLLFERFLNPDRISMPDIDVDFDDAGRGKVLEFVTKKYGADHVAHIVTFGQMAAKSVIKDVGRVMDYPLADTNKLAGARRHQQARGTRSRDAEDHLQEGDEYKGQERQPERRLLPGARRRLQL